MDWLESLWPSLVNQESGGNPNAVSPRGAFGTAQLMPGTASDPGFGVRPFNPNVQGDNERMGKDYFKAMLDRYQNDPQRALVAYNWGPGNADKWSGDLNSLPGETRNYVTSIMGNAGKPVSVAFKSGQPQSNPSAVGTAAVPGQPKTIDDLLARDEQQGPTQYDTMAQLIQAKMPDLAPKRGSMGGSGQATDWGSLVKALYSGAQYAK